MKENPFENALDSVAVQEKPKPKPVSFLEMMDFLGPVIWDIETGPLPDEKLTELFKFDPATVKGYELIDKEFDPASVKLGRMKDQAKIDAKIEAEREKFESAKAAAIEGMVTAEVDAFAAFKSKAALSALTGQVLAIGYLDLGAEELDVAIDDGRGDEKLLLTAFWEVFRMCLVREVSMIGFNTTGFDVPFIIRRSWAHGVTVPKGLFQNGRYLHRSLRDLRELWACGEYHPSGTLDDLAALFGTTRKNGDGGQFHKLWSGTPEERQQALDYLKNDLVMTKEVARAMQI